MRDRVHAVRERFSERLECYTGASAMDEVVLADENGGIGVKSHRWVVAVEFAINLPDHVIVSAATLFADVTQVLRDVRRIEDVPSDQFLSDGLGVPVRDVTPHVKRPTVGTTSAAAFAWEATSASTVRQQRHTNVLCSSATMAGSSHRWLKGTATFPRALFSCHRTVRRVPAAHRAPRRSG